MAGRNYNFAIPRSTRCELKLMLEWQGSPCQKRCRSSSEAAFRASPTEKAERPLQGSDKPRLAMTLALEQGRSGSGGRERKNGCETYPAHGIASVARSAPVLVPALSASGGNGEHSRSADDKYEEDYFLGKSLRMYNRLLAAGLKVKLPCAISHSS